MIYCGSGYGFGFGKVFVPVPVPVSVPDADLFSTVFNNKKFVQILHFNAKSNIVCQKDGA
jgi:hypothetical protein